MQSHSNETDYGFESVNGAITYWSNVVASMPEHAKYRSYNHHEVLAQAMRVVTRYRSSSLEAASTAECVNDDLDGRPVTRLANLIIIQIIESQQNAWVSDSNQGTDLRFVDEGGKVVLLKLPSVVLSVLVVRYIEMMSWNANEAPLIEGTVGIRWKGIDNKVAIRIGEGQSGDVIEIQKVI